MIMICAVLSVPARAQNYPKAEAFLGYSFVHYRQNSTSGTTTENVRSNLNGGVGQGTFNLTHNIGLVAEIAGYRVSHLSDTIQNGSSTVTVSGDLSGSVLSYLFGPRVSFRGNERWTPFVQALFGGAHISDITSSASVFCAPAASCTVSQAENSFAMALGGGLDVKVANHLAVRLGQVEYFMTRFSGSGSASDTQSNFRYSAGIVIR